MRFDEALGWYKVPAKIELSDGRVVDVATYLGSVRNDSDDLDSPLAFDVMNEKEARKLDAQERKAAELRATALEARPVKSVDMTTADLNGPAEGEDASEGVAGVSSKEALLSQPVRPRRGRPPRNRAA
jgi:hypothetical protein